MPSTILGEHSVLLPVGTTAQRPGSPSEGNFRYNSSKKGIEFYDGTQWVVVGEFLASGGTITDTGGYRIHTFTSSSSFVVTSGSIAGDILCVAGGGGGG